MNKTISGNLKSVWLYMLIAFALLPIIILSLILRLRILFGSVDYTNMFIVFCIYRASIYNRTINIFSLKGGNNK